MLSEDDINALTDMFAEKFSKVERTILDDIGRSLKEIKGLTPSQAQKLQQMYVYGESVDKITRKLASASGKSIKEIEALYERIARDGYEWASPFYEAKGVKQIPFEKNKQLQQLVKSTAILTVGEMANISRTTAIGINTKNGFMGFGRFYKNTIDEAIYAVATGVIDYNSAIKGAVKELAKSGLQVKYESGYTKRLDSAVRQNILDGVSYMTQEVAKQNGKAFGADGVEVSAHSPCAPDHLSYQGLQFSHKDYDQVQQSLSRPIGQWNCRHIAYPIILGISKPSNSVSQLKEMEKHSNEKILIEGKEYTRYECSQLQRKLETSLRYAKEELSMYKIVGNDELARDATQTIRVLSNKYSMISKSAELPTRGERTRGMR